MSERPTPETDALECAFTLLKCSPIGNPENSSEYGLAAYILSEHCQGKEDVSEAAMRIFAKRIADLERERDEAREEVASLRLEAKYHDEADALRRFRERERDEAREKAERYRLEVNAMMLQRDEAREAAAKWESSSDKLADTLRTDAYQYADYILNHYDRNSHMDKLCLAKSLVENGYGSKAAEIEAL